MIDLKKIVKIYKVGESETRVLHGIDLKIDKEEFVAIMGPSGSGKSTLMNIIGMLDTPTSGEYILNEKDVSKLSDDELAGIRLNSIGFVFQNFNLLSRATVLQNVMIPFLYTEEIISQEERIKKATAALQSIGLDEKELWHHLSNQLSGGQMQRVAIARALVNNPDLLLADEPTGNLDSKTGEVVMETFERLHNKDKRSIIMITHEMEVAEFADRIILLTDGKILKDYKNKN
ncbi:ABC transporter ATP-binding protein, partial [Patescibacteria group bacterium]|nr:ABC transporter ATP-binding protein [Patescibacteria group bacterium]